MEDLERNNIIKFLKTMIALEETELKESTDAKPETYETIGRKDAYCTVLDFINGVK